ncbi:MFS transporter [Bartonella sp. LJL80]
MVLSKAGTITLLATACLTIMVGAAIAPGVQSIASEIGLTVDPSWLITLPSLGVVIFGPFAARFITRAGCYLAMVSGLFLYGLLGVAGIFSHGILIFADRLLLGGATVLVMAAGTGLISEFFEGKSRLKMIALQGMSIEFGGVVFLFISGHLAVIGWFWPFFLYSIAWLLLVFAVFCIPHTSKQAAQQQQTPPDEVGGMNRVGDIYVAALLSLIVFFVTVITLPRHLQIFGYGEADAGSFLAFVSLVAVAAAAAMPRLTHILGEYKTLIAAFILYAIGYLLFSMGSTFAVFGLGAALIGMGFGLSVPLVNHMMVERSNTAQRGQNLAYLSIAIFLGQFLSSFATLIAHDTAVIFIFAAALAGLSAVLFVFIALKRQAN